jgi:hypothetical protein
VVGRMAAKKSEMAKMGLEAVHVKSDAAQEDSIQEAELSKKELAKMAASLQIGQHTFNIKQELLTIVKNFQRDLDDSIIDLCLTGSIAEPQKQLGTLCVVFVGDSSYLESLNPQEQDDEGSLIGFSDRTLYNLTPFDDDEFEVQVFDDVRTKAMHNLLVPMGGQHQLKGHREAAKIDPNVNLLRPNMSAWVYAISPVRSRVQ